MKKCCQAIWAIILLGVVALGSVGYAASCALLDVGFDPIAASETSRLELLNQVGSVFGQRNIKPVDIEKDARRLILASDWVKSQEVRQSHEWEAYSVGTLERWKKGADYVLANHSTMEFTSTELLRLHALTMSGTYFKGYEQRRIIDAGSRGKLTSDQVSDYLARIAAGERILYSGVNHRELAGRFREHFLDNDLTQGRPLLTTTHKLTPAQISEMRRGGIIEVRTEASGGEERVFISYPGAGEVQRLVETELAQLRSSINSSRPTAEKFSAIMSAYRNLVMIHPFLNGNGRTIRLFFDAVFMRMGLPPPVHNFDNEFVMSQREIEGRTLLGMADYLGLGTARP